MQKGTNHTELVAILKWFFLRLLIGAVLFFVLNFIYEKTLYKEDLKQYSSVKTQIDTAFNTGDIIYLGESSNTSFNPWTDTLNQSISDFLQLYIPNKKVKAVTHPAYHPGLFLKMLELLPEGDVSKKVIVLGVNMRTCGPSAMFSGNEASNQQEAVFYSKRYPLLSRIFMGLHFYDNRSGLEMERLKFQWWRTQDLSSVSSYNTALSWMESVISKMDIDRIEPTLRDSFQLDQISSMMGAYIKEFAFVLDEKNQRILDLKAIVTHCKKRNVRLIFHILPPNRHHAQMLFGKELVQIMDKNHQFLVKQLQEWDAEFIDNYSLREASEKVAVPVNYQKYYTDFSGSRFTDQWYPTEHYNQTIRQKIAESIAVQAFGVTRTAIELKQNNYPNWNVVMPLSDPQIIKFKSSNLYRP